MEKRTFLRKGLKKFNPPIQSLLSVLHQKNICITFVKEEAFDTRMQYWSRICPGMFTDILIFFYSPKYLS